MNEEIIIKKQSYDQIEQNIIKMFSEHDEARNSVNLGLFIYWALFDNAELRQVLYILGGHGITKLTPSSLIISKMRKIQNKEKRFQPSPEIQEKRRKLSEKIRQGWNK